MKHSKDVEKAIRESKKIAIEIGSNTIRAEHLFLALIENEDSIAYSLLHDENLNIDAIKQTLRDWSTSIQSQLGIFKQKASATIALDIETDKIKSRLGNTIDTAMETVEYWHTACEKNMIREFHERVRNDYEKRTM